MLRSAVCWAVDSITRNSWNHLQHRDRLDLLYNDV
jgi:hypothetical protein